MTISNGYIFALLIGMIFIFIGFEISSFGTMLSLITSILLIIYGFLMIIENQNQGFFSTGRFIIIFPFIYTFELKGYYKKKKVKNNEKNN